MSNPSFQKDLVKIGKSDRDPSIRSSELFTTGVPQSFNIEYYAFVKNHHALELAVHRRLAKYRFNESREFFICSIHTAIEVIRELANVELKFEEVLYKDKEKIDKEKALKLKEIKEKEDEQQNLKKSTEASEIIKSLKNDLNYIIEGEIRRNEAIAKSKSIYDKLMRRGDYFEFANKLKLLLQSHAEIVVYEIRKKYKEVNWKNDQLKLQSVILKNALRNLLRIRLAEYYSDFISPGVKYWGVVNKNKLDGYGVVAWGDGSYEQGLFVDGKRNGEFVQKDAENLIWIKNYKNDDILDSKNIDDNQLIFYKDQDKSSYLRLMQSASVPNRDSTTIPCITCNQLLRVPLGVTIDIRCPKCGNQWRGLY